jgi:hypothetical protein
MIYPMPSTVGAKLARPAATAKTAPSRFDELVASGVIRPPLEPGDPTEGWPEIRLPAGTAAEVIDADRRDGWHHSADFDRGNVVTRDVRVRENAKALGYAVG